MIIYHSFLFLWICIFYIYNIMIFDNIWFINKATGIHGNKYDYSLVNYVNLRTKVKIICPIHGEFEQTPDKHFRKRGCQKCGGTEKLTTEEFILKTKKKLK
jgi:hypothetical protein